MVSPLLQIDHGITVPNAHVPLLLPELRPSFNLLIRSLPKRHEIPVQSYFHWYRKLIIVWSLLLMVITANESPARLSSILMAAFLCNSQHNSIYFITVVVHQLVCFRMCRNSDVLLRHEYMEPRSFPIGNQPSKYGDALPCLRSTFQVLLFRQCQPRPATFSSPLPLSPQRSWLPLRQKNNPRLPISKFNIRGDGSLEMTFFVSIGTRDFHFRFSHYRFAYRSQTA